MTPTREQIAHLIGYVIDHGADHDDDCPGDDTCKCSLRARNRAVCDICGMLLAGVGARRISP